MDGPGRQDRVQCCEYRPGPSQRQNMVCVYWEAGQRLSSAPVHEAKQEAQLLAPDFEPWCLLTAGEVQDNYEW